MIQSDYGHNIHDDDDDDREKLFTITTKVTNIDTLAIEFFRIDERFTDASTECFQQSARVYRNQQQKNE